MSNYAYRGRPPDTLTADEQTRLLRASGDHREGMRDHLILAMALGAGLREHEIAALDVADVTDNHGQIRRRVDLPVFKGCRRKGAKPQAVVLPKELRRKLSLYLQARKPSAAEPLFPSRSQSWKPITTRALRNMIAKWCDRAGIRRRRFHELRHTYVTELVERSGGNLPLAQRMARHSRIDTTLVYAHVSAERMERAADGLRC